MSIRKGSKIIAGAGGGGGHADYINNQNPDSSIYHVYDWIGTEDEYLAQDIDNLHPDWVCFVTDDYIEPRNQYTNRNVGDIFYTSRKDDTLNGAVECDGSTYNFSDFEGIESINELLRDDKLPYVSLNDYALKLANDGVVGVFGWDGGESETFRVPTVKDIFLETGKASEIGDYIDAGLPDIQATWICDNRDGSTYHEASTGAVTQSYKNQSWSFNGGAAYSSSYKNTLKASKSNAIYGNSDTVQPEAIKYRAMIQLATGYSDEAVETCNSVKENIKRIKNTVTNCITEIPQNLKFELNDNLVTLKAGSKLYFPNGFEEDGVTRHFDIVITESDMSLTIYQTNKLLHVGGTNLGSSDLKMWYVSTTQPTGADVPQYYMWYDLTTNQVCYYDGTQLQIGNRTLPIGLYLDDSVQAFNGFSFAADHLFAFPGIKGLIPNGRNEDGTLKNQEFETTKILVCNSTYNTEYAHIALNSSRLMYVSDNDVKYNEDDNRFYVVSSGDQWGACFCGTCSVVNMKYNWIKNYNAIKLVEQNEFNEYKEQSLDYKNITNCITHIPQDIKLEQTSETKITLKAGSKVYIPNGFEADGTTKKFKTFCLNIDKEMDVRPYNDTYVIWLGNLSSEESEKFWNVSFNRCFSGAEQPTVTSNYALWYDTTNNIVKWTEDNGTTWISNQSLPIGIVDNVNNTSITIKQVFNGFGYIGSTVFALPGVKGLIPNGRNADGTLKNTEVSVSTVKTSTLQYDSEHIWSFYTSTGSITVDTIHSGQSVYFLKNLKNMYDLGITSGYNKCYVEETNLWYQNINTSTWTVTNMCPFAHTTSSSLKITTFNSKTDFHAVDYNEARFVVASMLPSSANNYTWYRLYNDGWVEQGGESALSENVPQSNQSTQSVTLPIKMKDSHYTLTVSSVTGDWGIIWCGRATTFFDLVQGNRSETGSKTYRATWQVSGMAA